MSSTKPLNNEILDERLFPRQIIRLDNYINIMTPILFQCAKKECGYIWKMAPHRIIGKQNTGCPKCEGNIRLTNESIDDQLKERSIRRLGNFTKVHSPIQFQCLKKDCNYIWESQPISVLGKNKTGCPKCVNNVRLTNEDIDTRLLNKKIKRIGDYNKNGNNPIEFQCLVESCKYIWKAMPNNVIGKRNSGCPNCSGNARLTNERIDEKIKSKFIKRIEDSKLSKTPILFQCLKCHNTWKTTPNHIIYHSGCPKCSARKTEKIIHDFLKTLITVNSIKHNCHRFYFDNSFARIDFFVNNNLVIEYNGEQHYRPVEHWGGKQQLKKQKIRDKKLRKYCKLHNHPLLEIPYTMKEEEWKTKILEFLSQHVSLENPIQQSA